MLLISPKELEERGKKGINLWKPFSKMDNIKSMAIVGLSARIIIMLDISNMD